MNLKFKIECEDRDKDEIKQRIMEACNDEVAKLKEESLIKSIYVIIV